MKKLIVASGNKNKIEEIKEILGDTYEIYSMKDMGFNEEIEETGNTFLENALIKAKTVSERFNEDVLSDDSGLCVSALNGAPAVYSARYSGINATDEKNNKLLLKNLINETDRNAKFVSCVVLYHAGGGYDYGEGSVKGVILNEYRGSGGFGYDPLFYCNELNKTFGEATAEEKNSISHRFRALMDLKKKIKEKK
jgi:XTP/dITP diphosphohydrolase